jgi:hypothetical protein
MGIAAVVFKGGRANTYLCTNRKSERHYQNPTQKVTCKVKKEMVLPRTMQQHQSDYRVRQTLNPLASARIAMLKF